MKFQSVMITVMTILLGVLVVVQMDNKVELAEGDLFASPIRNLQSCGLVHIGEWRPDYNRSYGFDRRTQDHGNDPLVLTSYDGEHCVYQAKEVFEFTKDTNIGFCRGTAIGSFEYDTPEHLMLVNGEHTTSGTYILETETETKVSGKCVYQFDVVFERTDT